MNLDALDRRFSGRLLTSQAEMAPFLTDWRKLWTGSAIAVAQPDTTEDVANIVRWCAEHQVPIVPQGGNTGMVGGSVPDPDGRALVISLKRLKRIRALDLINNTVTAEAGCVLAEVQNAAEDADRLFPLSLGSEGSCTIGGNLSTNAGGVQVLRYGNARDLCLGLEVVTADGTIWNGLRGLRKDNTGYDLKQLFIGAEGTLGIITAATLKLFPRPAAKMTALAAIDSPYAALRMFELAQKRLSATLTAFELMTDTCLALVAKHFPACRAPFDHSSPYYVLLESSDPYSEEHAAQAFNALMGEALEANIITDAAIAVSLAQSEAFWRIRDNLTEAQALEGDSTKHDISLPISSIADFIIETNARIERMYSGVCVIAFGHIGDGNLHYNVSARPGKDGPGFRSQVPEINELVYEAAHRAGGSISAEHGIGQLKIGMNVGYKPPVEIQMMAKIKAALDPDGLMNPRRVLPSSFD